MTEEILTSITTHAFAPILRCPRPAPGWQAVQLLAIFFLVGSSLPLTGSQDIFQPPSITKPDRPETVYHEVGSRFVIQCTATGVPNPSYSWQKVGGSIDNDNFVSYDRVTGMLNFTSFSAREEGAYMCVASNEAGNIRSASLSHPQMIKAARIDNFGSNSIQEVEAREYAYTSLECADQGVTAGDIQYGWYYKTSSVQVGMDNGRLFISDNGDLHFTYVLESDMNDSGETYHCGIGSSVLSLIKLGGDVALTVNDAPPTAIEPVLRYSNDGLKAKLATEARLVCFFSGYDPSGSSRLPTVTWMDDSKNVIVEDGVKYELADHNKVLIIKDVQESDDRTFHCQGSNSAGTTKMEPVKLNVTSPPLWEHPPENTVVPEGSDVTIKCVARSLEEEQAPRAPQWMINGMNFARAGKPKAVLSDDLKSVTVRDVKKPDDIMCFQCIVENSEGMTMGDACINVILGTTVTLQCDKCQDQTEGSCSCTDVDLPLGQSITFRFRATTDPAYANQLSYLWIVNGIAYRDPDIPPYMTHAVENGAQFYTLNTEGLSEDQYDKMRGRYVFSVFHPYDMKNVSIGINMKDPTPGASSAGLGVDIWVIFFILGLILILAVILIVIGCIVYRKLQEGDYNVDKKENKAGLDPAKELKQKSFPELSKPEYEDDRKKPIYILEYDDVPIGADDESLGEYGIEDDSRFNEDGSFIGNYSFNQQPNPYRQPVRVPVSNPPSLNTSVETTI